MRDFKKSRRRRWSLGWLLPLVLLALPTCGLPTAGAPCNGNCEDDDPEPEPDDPPPPFEPGVDPTSAVMCDIPKPLEPDEDECATDAEVDAGGWLSYAAAAVALNLGEESLLVLDFSPEPTSACALAGKPQKIRFHKPFPTGYPVCLNCGTQIPAKYPDFTAVCIAKCKELTSQGGSIPAGDVDQFCEQNVYVRVSTNVDKDECTHDFCSTAGMPDPDVNFVDPRRNPEDLQWTDGEHVTVVGNTLSFDGSPFPGEFSGGAASVQLITEGDAWVEFEAGQTGTSHVIAVRASCDDINVCPDGDETLGDIPLALSLNFDNSVYVIEDGDVLAGPFPEYTKGERFRINVVDHNDGTADISFTRFGTTPCVPDMPCNVPPFYTYQGARPGYPLRVDATFRETPASLVNVTIMRIIN